MVGGKSYGIWSNQTAIPEIGTNPEEGFFIKEKFGYYFNEKLAGTVDLNYLANYGFDFGFNYNYRFGEYNIGNFRIHNVTRTGWEGGMIHNIFLGTRGKKLLLRLR